MCIYVYSLPSMQSFSNSMKYINYPTPPFHNQQKIDFHECIFPNNKTLKKEKNVLPPPPLKKM